MKTQEKDTWREWVNKNPLRVWKETSNVYTMNELASRLNTTLITLNAWLLGMQIPRDERMARITKVTGIDKADMMAWYNQRP